MINWLFRLFVFLLPTQLAYHFWPQWAFIFGIRVDYFAPAIYLTDALFLLVLILSVATKKITLEFKTKDFYWALLVAVFVFLNVALASSPPLALMKAARLLELFLVFLFIKRTKKINFEKDFLKPLFYSAATFSIVGVLQFLKGGTLGGPLYFLGERTFSVLTPGISLAKIFGQDFLRPYSTFAHPNSLAGYLGVVLILCFTYKKLFSKVALLIIAIGILLSSSLEAFLSLAATFLIFYFFKNKPKIIKKISELIFPAAILFSFAIALMPLRKETAVFSDSLVKRVELASVSLQMVKENPLLGVGLNNFIFNLPRFSKEPAVSWFLQPVHNIYLLALSEAGAVGLFGLVFVLKRSLTASIKNKSFGIYLSLCFILLIGTMDHYFLTLQQNLLLFSLILGYSQRHEAK